MKEHDAAGTVRREFTRVAPDIIAAASVLPTATLHEAGGKIGALPSAIKPIDPAFRLCGPALTVHSPGGDNLWLHRALCMARPGDVLVVHVSDAHEHGYWGEIMNTAAKVRGLAGLVIDGCVRDGMLLEEMAFPVFARGLCMRGTGKDYGAIGWINEPVMVGNVVVSAGDLVAGDRDGVVVLPRVAAADIVRKGQRREAEEAEIIRRIEAGDTTMQVYGFH
jgi:4-hydroxy-4-methyl-2-oxoglutarate aldolase